MFHRIPALFFVCLFAFSVGCGPSQSSRSVEPITISPAEQVKNALQSVVTNGSVGSEVITLEEVIPQLEGAKATELKADLEELQSLQGAKAVAKAKAMIAKL